MYKLTVTANGVRLVSAPERDVHPGKRGNVRGMSDAARRRFMWFLNSVMFEGVDFVTLTYRENVTDAERVYADLRRFHKALQRAYGPTGIIWRREVQKRGAYHFHLFVIDKAVPKDAYTDLWLAATDGLGDLARRKYGVDVKQIDRLAGGDAGVIVAYMTKYAAKDGGADGRQWGVLGKKHITTFSYTWNLRCDEYDATKRKLQEVGAKSKVVEIAQTEVTQRYFGTVGRLSQGSSEFIPKR